MYTSAKPYFYGTGRRKKSVARVRIYPGTGTITINKRDIDDYFGLETLKLIVNQPFAVTGTEGKFDIVCTAAGGGISGQAGAIRHFRRIKPIRRFSRRPAFSPVTRERKKERSTDSRQPAVLRSSPRDNIFQSKLTLPKNGERFVFLSP